MLALGPVPDGGRAWGVGGGDSSHMTALACQPPKQVTARPSRPTSRKSRAHREGRKQKVKLGHSRTELCPEAQPREAPDRPVAPEPQSFLPRQPRSSPLSKCTHLSAWQLVADLKNVCAPNGPAVGPQGPGSGLRGAQGSDGDPRCSPRPWRWLRPRGRGRGAWMGHRQSLLLPFGCVLSLI